MGYLHTWQVHVHLLGRCPVNTAGQSSVFHIEAAAQDSPEAGTFQLVFKEGGGAGRAVVLFWKIPEGAGVEWEHKGCQAVGTL